MATRQRSGRRRWLGWLGVAAGAASVAAALDLAALEHHLHAGPFDFSGAACAGSAGAAAQAPAAATTQAGLGEWTGFLAGGLHNLAIPAAGSAGSLRAAWTFATNGTVSLPPAVVGGVAYFGSMDGCVYALDVATGRLLWSFGADNQVMSEPLVVDGRVFFATGNKALVVGPVGMVRGSGASGIYALDAATGEVLWFVATDGGNMPTPAYRDGVVYEVGGGERLYAVQADSGQLLWTLPVGSYVSMSSPTFSGDIAVFGGALPYALIGVDVSAHRVAWTLPLPQAGGGVDDITPAVDNGVAYVQIPEGKIVKRVLEVAVNAQDGAVLWRRPLGTVYLNLVQRALGRGDLGARDGEETGVATLADGVLYVGSPALRALWALDPRTGAPTWSHPARLGQGVRTAPAVAGDIILASSNTTLFALDRTSGRVLRRTPLGAFRQGSGIMMPCTTAGPLVIGDTVIVGAGTDSQALRALPLEAVV